MTCHYRADSRSAINLLSLENHICHLRTQKQGRIVIIKIKNHLSQAKSNEHDIV